MSRLFSSHASASTSTKTNRLTRAFCQCQLRQNLHPQRLQKSLARNHSLPQQRLRKAREPSVPHHLLQLEEVNQLLRRLKVVNLPRLELVHLRLKLPPVPLQTIKNLQVVVLSQLPPNQISPSLREQLLHQSHLLAVRPPQAISPNLQLLLELLPSPIQNHLLRNQKRRRKIQPRSLNKRRRTRLRNACHT